MPVHPTATKLIAGLSFVALVACESTPETTIEPPVERDGGTTIEDPRDAGNTIEDPRDGGVAEVTWWQDVQPIVAEKCQLCHAEPPQFGAPRPFVDYDHTQVASAGTPVHEIMAARINASQQRMPPPSQPQLTDEERALITLWSEIGAPEGTPPPPDRDGGVDTRDGGDVPRDGGEPDTRTVSRVLEIRATQPNSTDPYELPQRTTNYRCWAMTVPAGNAMGQEYMFRFEPLIDNTAHTHHTLLFKNTGQLEPEGVPFDCGSVQLSWNMVAGWAPGRTADEIPRGAGVPIAQGEQLILQVHYDSVTDGNQTDNSGARVILTDDTNLEEAGMLWCGNIWQGPMNGPAEVKTQTWNVSQNMTIFSVFPHLHQTGTKISLELQRSGSTEWISLVDIQAWDFNDQPNVDIAPEHQQLQSGDRLRTRCEYNTQGQNVSWGEGSADEMCFNFVYHYPRINFEYACVRYEF